MYNLVTKRGILFTGMFGLCVWLSLSLFNTFIFSIGGSCLGNYVGWCDDVTKFIENTAPFTIPFFALFFFSLITYWMRDEVFYAWSHFVRWWIPFTLFLLFITPSDTGGGGFGPQLSLGKPDIALLTSFLFCLISLVLICYKYFYLRKK